MRAGGIELSLPELFPDIELDPEHEAHVVDDAQTRVEVLLWDLDGGLLQIELRVRQDPLEDTDRFELPPRQVIGQELAQQWPAIVEAAAKPFGAVDQMIVLNGAQGVSEMLAQALSQGITGLKLARGLLGTGLGGDDEVAKTNGHVDVPPPPPPAPVLPATKVGDAETREDDQG